MYENTMVLQSDTTTVPWYHHSTFEKDSKKKPQHFPELEYSWESKKKKKKSACVDPTDVKDENIHKLVITGRDFQHMWKYIANSHRLIRYSSAHINSSVCILLYNPWWKLNDVFFKALKWSCTQLCQSLRHMTSPCIWKGYRCLNHQESADWGLWSNLFTGFKAGKPQRMSVMNSIHSMNVGSFIPSKNTSETDNTL